MKIRSLLFAFILSALFFSGGMFSATQAQTLDQTLSGCNGAAPLRTIQATPSNYKSLIAGLLPGDRLLLAAGTYTQGLNLWYKNGEPGKCIVIEGPASGSPAVFTGSDTWNIVSFSDSSYIAVRNLSLDGQNKAGDGVKAEAGSVYAHHILIEGLSFKNFNPNGLRVGISTKCPAWNWVIRRNTITSTGTGLYIGGSSGEFEHTNFLVEHNLIHGTIEYNAQFKHQLGRNTSIGVPASGTTIIRHNVFSMETGSISGADARPNLLVGHWPTSGAGSSDIYQIYGNLFYQNPYESLFQGEGNLAFHDNLLVKRTGGAVRIQPHNHVPRRIDIFNNTVVAPGTGIYITGADPAYPQRVVGNAVFAGTPLTGGQQSNNVTGSYTAASTYLNNPMAALGSGLDLYPKTGQLQGAAIDYSAFTGLMEWNRDFNSRARVETYRGAYSGDGVNPGWTPALAIKPEPSAGNQPPPACTSISDVEPNNTMTAPQSISGSCNQISGTFLNDSSTQRSDYFRLNLPAGRTVTALLNGLTVDYDLEIYDAAGNWVGSSYNGGATSEQASWTNTGASAINVYIHVYRASSTRTTYQLKVSYPTDSTCTSISDVEPNNTMTAPQSISGSCNQISGTFLNDSSTQRSDYFRLSLPAGRTVTALLNGLTVDYDLEIYDAAGNWVGSSYNGGATSEQASWTNTGASAIDVYIHVYRASSTQTTYQLKVSY
ncbi:MAG TPA: hypothetical protein VEZ40_09160 [Pyrinomonadaceae bacterium]|nr:hypothetical protein [Pyrinomonadaceae bacterium]